jgi:hypothetical protein
MEQKKETGVDITKRNVTILTDPLRFQAEDMRIKEGKRQIITKFTLLKRQ